MRKTMITGMIGLLGITAQAQLEKGYNALQVGIVDKNIGTRAITNIDYKIGETAIGYHAVNEMEGTTGNYFGRHVATVGKEFSLTTVIKANANGIQDVKVGVRDKKLVETLVDYGSVDVTFDKTAVNFAAMIGKTLPHGIDIEMYHDVEMPFDNKVQHYFEAEIKKKIGDNTKGFARYKDAWYMDKPTLMIGLEYNR